MPVLVAACDDKDLASCLAPGGRRRPNLVRRTLRGTRNLAKRTCLGVAPFLTFADTPQQVILEIEPPAAEGAGR